MQVCCAQCGTLCDKPSGAVNRAREIGAPLYCNRTCAGLARRKHKTAAQKVEEKRLYDAEYRIKNATALKAKKAEYFQRTYDPATAAIERKKRMPHHVEYCRRPEYKAWKREYDAKYKAKADYGEFWEAAILATEIDREVVSRITKEEVRAINGTRNKSLERKRDYARLTGTK